MPPKTTRKRKVAELATSAEQTASATPPPANREQTSPHVDLDFMTISRPMFDFHEQYDPDDLAKMSKKKIDKLEKDYNAENELHFKKDIKDFPEWKWIVSRKGYKMFVNMDVDIQKRDQDRFMMHVYTDFSGYGVQEVIENWVSSTVF